MGQSSPNKNLGSPDVKSINGLEKVTSLIKAVIDAWDPYSLLASGAPADEFAIEINALAYGVRNIKSQDDAALAISRVFSRYFTPEDFSVDACREVGVELHKALKEAGLLSRNE